MRFFSLTPLFLSSGLRGLSSFLRHQQKIIPSPSRIVKIQVPVVRSFATMANDTNAHKYQTHPILVWVDCEMTGLEIEKDRLLEVAVILTDSDLNEVQSLGPLHIQTSQEVLDNMNDWCKKNHKKSGLTAACLKSDLTIEAVDDQLHDLLTKHGITRAGLAGNSVSYDRLFLQKWCPKFSSLLHYRNIDVSSFKEIVKRWYPDETAFPKKLVHRALDDIRESINEMKYYHEVYFRPREEVAAITARLKEEKKK